MDNREKILNCALELFHARGYDAVGVQEIAEMAGVTKPTLYYYCLLYTSPSPRDRSVSRMPSSA